MPAASRVIFASSASMRSIYVPIETILISSAAAIKAPIPANPDNWCGQVLLMVQVVFGYVLLGALITRLAVLFTGDGPAGRFAKDKKIKREN